MKNNWFKSFFTWNPPLITTGALISTDIAPVVFSDIVGKANVVNWDKTTFRSFPVLNQKSSYMCGAFSAKKHLGIGYAQKYGKYIDFSEEDVYQRRRNFGEQGMYFTDITKIMTEGVTLKILTDVNIKRDSDADDYVIALWKRDVGKVFAISQPVYIPTGAFETIASVIQTTGKSVIGLMYFTYDEWATEYPKVVKSMDYDNPSAFHHFINFVDYVTINGIKYLVVEDSAHFGGISVRFVSKHFLEARNIPTPMANAYLMNFKFEKTEIASIHFTGSIISLQECLQALGYFPTNVSKAENIGPTTKKALEKFQNAYSLPVTMKLDDATRSLVTRLFP